MQNLAVPLRSYGNFLHLELVRGMHLQIGAENLGNTCLVWDAFCMHDSAEYRLGKWGLGSDTKGPALQLADVFVCDTCHMSDLKIE